MHQGATSGLLSSTDKNLDRAERLVVKSDENEGGSSDVPLRSFTPPSDFWREMSPQLSYIDGSSVSSVGPSYGRSVSWNLTDFDAPPGTPQSLDLLDIRQNTRDTEGLASLTRHVSDALWSSVPGDKGRHKNRSSLEAVDASFAAADDDNDEFSPPADRPIGICNTLLSSSTSNLSGAHHRSQLAVVRVHRPGDVKRKIQKHLSFKDPVDLQTTIYTPPPFEDAPDNCTHHQWVYEGGALTNSSSWRSTKEKRYNGEGETTTGVAYQGPPLVRRMSMDSQNQLYMDKDLRYYFQHPWLRLIVAYLVIFCNFLLFAEDPVSHSHTESKIPVVGNVFSFIATKYPDEWYWKMIKVIVWLIGIMCGMLVGKVLIHGIFFKRMLRLKMFRDEQGSWMTMFLTVIVSLYMFSYVYNLVLLIGHWDYLTWQIDRSMGVTNENMMKAAATCTWLGDLVTALMVTDMMLQDNLYPYWATSFRRLYRLSNVPRILIFWIGSIMVAIIVIFLIVSDYISWDYLNKGFVETTELSRAFLASFILVMDLLIVMQDWDFPHFTSNIDVNLPGFSTHTLHWRYAETKVTGKWFNYGIIFLVMMFDLNMWKNQIFYYPEVYGQYIDPGSRKVFTVEDEEMLWLGNETLWTWEARGEVDPETGIPYRDNDMFMYSRFMEYELVVKCTAFIPNVLGVLMLFTLVTLYGRFPPNKDETHGGRLKKRKRSSWRRERRTPTVDPGYRERHSSAETRGERRRTRRREFGYRECSVGVVDPSTGPAGHTAAECVTNQIKVKSKDDSTNL